MNAVHKTTLMATWLVLVTALAGCFGGGDGGSGDDGPPDPVQPPPGNNTSTPPLPTIEEFEDPNHPCVARGAEREHAPDLEGRPWVFGQSWLYRVIIDGEDLGTTRLVYYDLQDNGQHYMVGTPTREEALRHALYSTNPMIGRVHQALYSPHESGDHADMFHFPLCDGLTWKTRFFATDWAMSAKEAALPIVGGPLDDYAAGTTMPGWRITGTAPDASLGIAYSLHAQWFTDLSVTTPETTVEMTLEEIDTGYQGEAFFLRGQKDKVFPINSVEIVTESFDIQDGNDGPYDTIGVAITAEQTGGNGVHRIELLDPNDEAVVTVDIGDTGNATVDVLTEVPYQAGNWTLRSTPLPPSGIPGGIEVTGEVRLVSIYDRSGSV